MTLLFFAFISGLVTILAPCVWPILPVVLSVSAKGGRKKPLGVTLGVMVSFAFFTLTLSTLVKIFPLNPNDLRLLAVFIIGILGITLIIPRLSQQLEGFVSWLSRYFGGSSVNNHSGFWGGFLTGLSLGIVWSPCAGPILATIAALSVTNVLSTSLVLVTIAYVLGIGIPLFLFAYFGSSLLANSRFVSPYTGRIQQAFGIVMVLTAIAIGTNYDKVIQAKLLNVFPSYSNFLYKFEESDVVKKELEALKGNNSLQRQSFGNAPEFAGIEHWINSDPLTMSELRGKVVLVDFWTYTCINCIRTLPYVTKWYEKYKEKGFVVVGVHTPEFEFEKDTKNVEDAVKRYNINYPVAQDNLYGTWNAYSNQYWPAKYLVDVNGVVRDTHFGEGAYEETEKAIQALLAEKGVKIDGSVVLDEDTTPRERITPETYLGVLRNERFASQEPLEKGKAQYTFLPSLPSHTVAFSGMWNAQDEYSSSFPGSKLQLHFYAKNVYLVFQPTGKNDRVKVLLDGRQVTEQAGVDVKNGYIQFDTQRLYHLIKLQQTGEHTLELQFETEGIKIFAFTFG